MKQLFKLDEIKLGYGPVVFSWSSDGTILACSGSNNMLTLFSKHGNLLDEVDLEQEILDWSKSSSFLAVNFSSDDDVIFIYQLKTRNISKLSAGVDCISFLQWSSYGNFLGVGGQKGGICIYNKDTNTKETFFGKHSASICSGAWTSSRTNLLLLGGKDNLITINNIKGKTLLSIGCNHIPKKILLVPENTTKKLSWNISANLESECIWFYSEKTASDEEDKGDINSTPGKQVQLTFEPKYGKLLDYHFLTSGDVAVGFNTGFVIVACATEDGFGEEIFVSKIFEEGLSVMLNCADLARIVFGFGSGIKIYSEVKHNTSGDILRLHAETRVDEDFLPTSCDFSGNTNICSVASSKGCLYSLLIRAPLVSTVHRSFANPRLAYLSSLKEVTVLDLKNYIDITSPRLKEDANSVNGCKKWTHSLSFEPALIAANQDIVLCVYERKIQVYAETKLTDLIKSRRKKSSQIDAQESKTQISFKLSEVELQDQVEFIVVNEDNYVVALVEGKAFIYYIILDTSSKIQLIDTIDTQDRAYESITAIGIVKDFFIYGTSQGMIQYYSLIRKECLEKFRYQSSAKSSIKKLFPNISGTKVAYLDATNTFYLMFPTFLSYPLVIRKQVEPSSIVLWDLADQLSYCFFLVTKTDVSTFIHTPQSLSAVLNDSLSGEITEIGPLQVGEDGSISMTPLATKLFPGYIPLCVYGGILICHFAESSKLGSIILGTHDSLPGSIFERPLHKNLKTLEEPTKEKRFCQHLALNQHEHAWIEVLNIKNRKYWLALSTKLLETLNIQLVIHLWRELGNGSMVYTLEHILMDIRAIGKKREEKKYVAGRILVLFGEYGKAEKLLLESSEPEAALDMRKKLNQYKEALVLANSMVKEGKALSSDLDIAEVAFKYALELEAEDDFPQALKLFQLSLENLKTLEVEKKYPEASTLANQCKSHIAKLSLRIGDISQGVELALQLADKYICKECADILLDLFIESDTNSERWMYDAARLYQMAQENDKACKLYIKLNNFKTVSKLIDTVTDSIVLSDYAAARERYEDYQTAVKYYKKAARYEECIRLYLFKLSVPGKAFQLVREWNSKTGAKKCADYCVSTNDIKQAIEFSFIAEEWDEALNLAISHHENENTIKVLERCLENNALRNTLKIDSSFFYNSLAEYFEQRHDTLKAAEYYTCCGQFHKAISLLLSSNDPGSIEKAIQVVGNAKNDLLTHTVIDFLMGETDNIPKDAVYIFKLYVALNNFAEAANTAELIAKQQQASCNFSKAHKIVFQIEETLRTRNTDVKLPQSVYMLMMILHSYLLVKKRIKVGDIIGAIRLLERVYNSPLGFNEEAVAKVLTTLVLLTQKASFKDLCLKYADILMEQNYRSQIEPKYKRKIETIVRKRGNLFQKVFSLPSELALHSPFSEALVPEYKLVCPVSSVQIPFCIVTGKHVTLQDYCVCPNSGLPAIYSEYITYLRNFDNKDSVDPVWSRPITVSQIKKLTPDEAKKHLTKLTSNY
eukprot:maker-scaffold_20-snap-gene-2.1-mRNA-1 protein AED:0.01 eAED:0.02 QI:0/0/0/1/1/1/2/0/1497